MKTKDNPVIERIRRARRKITKACGDDVRRLGEYYISLQKKRRKSLATKEK